MRDVIRDILACGTAPENWNKAHDTLVAELAISASSMYSVNNFRSNQLDIRMSRDLRRTMTQEKRTLIQKSSEDPENRGYQFLRSNPEQTFYNDYEVHGLPENQNLPVSATKAMLGSDGYVMHCGAALNTNGPWLDVILSFHRSEAEWRSFLKNNRTPVVLPIIANTLMLQRALSEIQSRYGAMLTALNSLGLGVFLVSETGTVIDFNTEAQNIIDQRDGIFFSRRNRLRLNDPSQSAFFTEKLSKTFRQLQGEPEQESIYLSARRTSGRFDYLMSVRPLMDTNAEMEAGFQCAFVMVIDPSRPQNLSVKGIETLGRLTPAETAVADLMIKGNRTKEIALERDVSVHTIKRQFKAIFQKLHCSGQSEVIRVAAATRLPFVD
ncbi:helix-turn-helix transcriptional regulator [Ruegeria sp. HKCCD8929]|uniref:helix-turn-helix transcriptional regulator n=1 Tax=Ruegeria sp. HKCCD8929 TaxID=2683006 RepID=UPI001488BA0C|nr:helix-turn-helix transcriptional regulator [Ruegeria sp. HKCCD8929]